MMTRVRCVVKNSEDHPCLLVACIEFLGLPPVDQRVSVEFGLQSGRMKFNIEAYVTVGVYRICMRSLKAPVSALFQPGHK